MRSHAKERSSSLDIRSEGSSVTAFFSSLWPSEPTKITSESITFTLYKDNMLSKSPPYEITCQRKAKKMRS